MHRVPLELVAIIACPQLGLLASTLGGKASTNLGAIQILLMGTLPVVIND
jgi:hypothetical protein